MERILKISNENLSILLNKVKRTQTVGGKKQDQVNSCIIKTTLNRGQSLGNTDDFRSFETYVTSLVKDGLTSVSKFTAHVDSINLNDPLSHLGNFFITDINTVLGVLKYHGPSLTLEQENDRLRIKSSNKQTTLTASPKALAFPHNPKTLLEWTTASETIASYMIKENDMWVYKGKNGDEMPATLVIKVNAVTLYEALRCDSMNAQKINRYEFYTSNDGYRVRTGGLLKGLTTSLIVPNPDPSHAFTATFEGGLENLLSHYNGDITLNFFDFTQHSQGWKLLLDLGGGEFVFQSSVLGE